MADEAPDDWDAELSESGEEQVAQPTPANGHIKQATDAANGHADTSTQSSAAPISAPTSKADHESESEDEDDSSADYTSTVLNAYGRLQSRRVDLVGDYAGNELFLIDGNSMLLRCFSDETLDFDPGLQLLHATWIVEQFLSNLIRRKCNFHVVFFDSTKSLCIPPAVDTAKASKYLFARAAIIKHLQAHLLTSHPMVKVHEFGSYTSVDFDNYLRVMAPYFIMANDGAASSQRRGKHIKRDQDRTEQQHASRAALREEILFFIERGYNVALLNGLEWRDTKIMSMVLERRNRAPAEAAERGQLQPDKVREDAHSNSLGDRLPEIMGSENGLSQRQVLSVLALAEAIRVENNIVDVTKLAKLTHSFLLHEATLAHTALSSRRLPNQEPSQEAQDFIGTVAKEAEKILHSAVWGAVVKESTLPCDLADTLDGRLFYACVSNPPQLPGEVQTTYEKMLTALMSLTDLSLPESEGTAQSMPPQHVNGSARPNITIMPFSNPVFDKHLTPVRLRTDERAAGQQTASAHKIFREVTHWHNIKKPLIQRGPPTAQSQKQAFWAAKRNQQFMAEMQKYAASLTNAVGRSLEPETIIVGATKPRLVSGTQTPDSDSTDESTSSKGKGQASKGGGVKKGKQSTTKQAMMNQIAAAKAKKEESASDKAVAAWRTVCKGIDAGTDLKVKYRKTRDYLANLKKPERNVLAAECQLYMLNCLYQHWIDLCRKGEKAKFMDVAAAIWNTCRTIRTSEGLTDGVWGHTERTATAMGLPTISTGPVSSLPSRKLAFTFASLRTTDDVSVGFAPREFQLRFCGPYLERGFDSGPDNRVDFQPDGWQRRVLDAIDADKSVFAVAPTSAGKTFISFYAMRKVLESDDNGVLVYVAPTKALVNQIAAEIQARYKKNYKYGGKSVWAIHTRDYRINNPTGCQVLVTVPHVLQIMLLAPTNANSWSTRVKRIIFDEVHSIGQAEDGVVWEQLLLLAPCPIIALSATVGNPHEFSEWLSTTQNTIGIDLTNVQHPHRYSDLRKYYYVPPEQFAFQGLAEKTAFGRMGLEQGDGLNHVHPVVGLVDRSRGIPEDLALEPNDCLTLFNAMRKHSSDAYPVPNDLSPEKALPVLSKKVDILNWERKLKALLLKWIEDRDSPYTNVVKELEKDFRDTKRAPLQTTGPEAPTDGIKREVSQDLLDSTLPLLCRLHEQDALPGILFNYDRNDCERLCRTLVDQLTAAELEQVKSGPKWEKKLERWEEWKKAQFKAAERAAKAGKKADKKRDKADDDEKSSKLDQQMEAGASEASSWESFDPEAPVNGYHFADHSRVLLSELDIYVAQLGRRGVEPYLIDALKRGIGVHHAGMNRKYRQVVEMLFRQGFLRVVIATGTLALGINMPCKTVVFSGDSVFLTALNYRQCAGRAGRRGFDLLGNVIFHGISREKVCRLISSRLPDLNGHFPITTTLVLRLFTLLHESKNSSYAVSAINALLSQPRLYMGGPSFKEQTMHHLRFSIEYLRRQYLLGANGAPLNFAGLVSHLYFAENSSFAFHALLKEGYFHELCAKIENSEKETLETLMLIMAHLFGRIPCRQADEEYKAKVVKPSSSVVFLPEMPKHAAEILRRHNDQTLDVCRTYVETFVDQHITTVDRKLPLTGVEAGAEGGAAVVEALPASKTRSAFVALSGHGDDFESISALCHTTREGVFLEEAVIPYVTIHPDETDVPLNAYLLDFFKHGDVHTIERANGIRRADIWFLLNDFSLVLATLITSIAGFMKLRDANDMDMLDLMGDFDAHEEATEEKAAAGEENDAQSIAGASVADSVIGMPEQPKQVPKKKTKKAESWEDVADEEDALASVEEAYQKSGGVTEAEAKEVGMWGDDGNNRGLKNVLKAFTKLRSEFTVRFRAMWA